MVKQEIIDTEMQIIRKCYNNDEKSIPNFVIHSETVINSEIYFPYFPFQTLHLFLNQVNSREIFFTNVDKIVMMKEIAIALNQLHKNGIFHQNLNSSYIFISETKNAYIGGFAYDPEVELLNTKIVASNFYRDFEKKNPTGPIINDAKTSEENKYIMYDVYSYGVLLYEIITTQCPVDLFLDKSRREIMEILEKNYHEFLFDKYQNSDFDEYYGMIGIRKIIDKCMRKNNDQSYGSFKEIINDLENLDLYKKHKEEIEYRILNAEDTNSYKCNFSNIVVTYFLGNSKSFSIIKSFFQKFQQGVNYAEKIQMKEYDNLLKYILEFFEFKNQLIDDSNENLFFQSYFNEIINEVAFSIIENKKIIKDNNKSLILLSQEKNKMPNIIPIASLKSFLNEFQINDPKMMIYFIAKEISMIHSKKLFHGELSLDSIGIYFNSQTKSFIPAIIPFYIFYSNEKSENSDVFFDDQYSSNYLHKMQKKDIKKFLKIVKILDSDFFLKLSNKSDIYLIESYVYEIFNIIIQNQNNESRQQFLLNCSKYDYSFFQLNFPTIYDVFITSNQNSIIYKVFNHFLNQKPTYLNIQNTLQRIIKFSNEKIKNQNYLEVNLSNNKNHDIIELFARIKKNNSISKQISDSLDNKKNIEKKEIPALINKKRESFNLINYSSSEIDFRNRKNKIQSETYVNRKLEITELEINSIKFIIYRYIKTLNPMLNYRVTLRITNKFDCIRQQKNYKLSDIEQIVKGLRYNYEISNGCIIIIIQKKAESH